MKKIISSLFLVFVFGGACYANNEVLSNIDKQLHWNGDIVLAVVERSYYGALLDLGGIRDSELYAFGEDSEEYKNSKREYDSIYKEYEQVLQNLLGRETFSIRDIMFICSNKTLTMKYYSYICENMAKEFGLVAVKAYEQDSSTKVIGDSVVVKKQNCVQHEIDYRGLQAKRDDEFLYSGIRNMNKGFGYECDPDGEGDTCDEDDVVFMPYAYIGDEATDGKTFRFKCVHGVANDYWDPLD
jgi:hypothetical protein